MQLREGAAEMLAALRDRGLYRAVLSNAHDDFLGPTLARSGLDVLLDDWTSSEEARSCKPDPAIHLFALRKAGRSADAVLFVGDSLQHAAARKRIHVGDLVAQLQRSIVATSEPA